MRAVHFDPKDARHADFWRRWHPRAQRATKRIVEAWEDWIAANDVRAEFSYDFEDHSPVWRDFKEYLSRELFFRNCAYCESPDEACSPRAEHYRPKRAPEADNGLATGKLADGREIPHPGYFWLALAWRNLVPSCERCNATPAKGNQFPARNDYRLEALLEPHEVAALKDPNGAIQSPRRAKVYFLSSADLDAQEQPLALMPMNCEPAGDPARHLIFGVTGIVSSRNGSEIGERSIALYDLRRDSLARARHRAQERIQWMAEANRDLTGFREGREPHSTAALDSLKLI